jgi:succinate dehydrogenase/fumarate reductase flavoprotein subunit
MPEESVIIIGTGGAGLRGALELRGAGVRVVVVSKGGAGISGATPSGLYSYCAADPSDPSNPPDLFREDILRSGLTVNDPLLVDFLCRDGYARLQDLAAWGMPWERSADGAIARTQLPGHCAPRAFFVDRRTGHAMTQTLLRACRSVGVEFVQYHAALDLVLEEGRICGLILLDWVKGEPSLWKCDALIVASGGAAGLYRLNTNPPGQTGDGMGLILRAGGELVDMEFMQMYPTVLVHPPAAYGQEFASAQLLAAGAFLLNRKGEEFFSRWEDIPVGQATRDVLSRGIAREIASGGGTEAGGVILDARHVPHMLKADRYVQYLEEIGVDPLRSTLQVAPGAHYSLGGVRVQAPTVCVGLSGVFAAGEVLGGLHGANRLAGNALSEIQVFGARAGEEALAYLKKIPKEGKKRTDRQPPQKGASPLWDAICEGRARKTGCSIGDLKESLRGLMDRHGGVIRTKKGLEEALAGLEEIRDSFENQMALPDRHEPWHPEWLAAAEIGNMIEVSRALLASAWARTESRGAHYRDDYPQRDPRWDGHNLIVKGAGKSMAVLRRDRSCGREWKVWP